MPDRDTRPSQPAAPPASEPPAADARELLGALPTLARVGWFGLGALAATTVTLVVMLRPWARPREHERAPPYEGFPFADNAGVCQEHVALATLRTSHEDAQASARRLARVLPP